MITGIFDSHAHYDDEAFSEDRDALLSSFPQKGIMHIINVATDPGSILSSVRLAERYGYLSAAIGVHPSFAGKVTKEEALSAIRQSASSHQVVAIGEIGLDYHYKEPKDPQKELFIAQMALAEKLRLPVIIHSRDATEDTLNILKSFKKVKGVVHCFSGSAQTAQELIKMGYFIGFTGVITFSNAKKTAAAAQAVPLSRLLVETDCPYLAPTPFRGKRCDSSLLPYTIEKLAEIKGISAQKMADCSRENAQNFFHLESSER